MKIGIIRGDLEKRGSTTKSEFLISIQLESNQIDRFPITLSFGLELVAP
jgi:hypothetical protein